MSYLELEVDVGRRLLLEERYKILIQIADFLDSHDYGPSFQDLGSKGAAYYYCQDLLDAGLLVYDQGIARSLRLTEAGRELVEKLRKIEETIEE